jgi:predicted MFS family arabinose efflux permease
MMPVTTGSPVWTYRRLLRERQVGRLLGSALLARLGEQMFALALVLHVLAEFGSPQLAGIAVFASFAPGMIVSPFAGALLDRFGALRAIGLDMVASAVLVAVLAWVPDGQPVSLIALATLFSLTNPLGIAGIRTAMPRLVPGSAMERANALDIGSYNLVEVAGPVLAGALFVVVGGPITFVVIAVLYAGGFLLLPAAAEEPPRLAGSRGGRPRLLRDALAGVRYVLTHRVLRALVVSYGLYQVAWGVLVVAVPTVAAGTSAATRDGGAEAGLLWGTVGLSGIVSALVMGRVSKEGRERAAIVLGTLATGCVAVPLMAWGGVAGLVCGLVVLGLASGPVNIGLLTLRQRRTDPGWLGRVLAISISLNLIGMPIGSALGGHLTASSPTLAFVVAGVAALLAALAAWVLIGNSPRDRDGSMTLWGRLV